MNTIIKDLHIHIVKVDTTRSIYVNGNDEPYHMVWNKQLFRWEFSDADAPDDVKAVESDISNFIMHAEKLEHT